MSAAETADHPHEVIIIRHGGHGDHDDHHGGAWKIAFADFMTAMMCFFLVMWLINAANEQTKASVASYFNPVKLMDRNSSRKGLSDEGEGQQAGGATTSTPAKPTAEPTDSAPPKPDATSDEQAEQAVQPGTYSDEQLFQDPFAVLAEIASETGVMQNTSAKGEGGAQDAGPATGASGGESYRDPFAPDFWSKQIAVPEDIGENPREGSSDPDAKTGNFDVMSSAPAPLDAEAFPASPPEPTPRPEPVPEPTIESVEAAAEPEPESEKVAPEVAAVKPDAMMPPLPEPAGPTEEARQAAEAVRADLAGRLGVKPDELEGVSVTAEKQGVLISVTDQIQDGMFEIGSAVPRRDLILAMEKIAESIAAQPGTVAISGHTDARPFRGESYDDWRLSTARAQSAYYMLIRAGLDDKRVREVAGFADRALKVADDPMADANRRIEILIELPQ